MSGLINKDIVLCLNKSWVPIGTKTVKDAIISMCSGGDQKPFKALNIEYDCYRDGTPDFESVFKIEPLSFDEWIQLPCFSWHLKIKTANKEIRCPTVIIATDYNKIVMKKPRLSRDSIYFRDGGRCIYTGKKLSKNSATIEHIIPKSRWKEKGMAGSPDNWLNVALCDKQINFKKGNKTPEEAGLKPLWKPSEPGAVPQYALITEARHKDWERFIINSK